MMDSKGNFGGSYVTISQVQKLYSPVITLRRQAVTFRPRTIGNTSCVFVLIVRHITALSIKFNIESMVNCNTLVQHME